MIVSRIGIVIWLINYLQLNNSTFLNINKYAIILTVMFQIIIKQGDITTEEADAIVNAANNELLHGGGVAGAILAKGGQVIQEESNKIAPIPLGEAAVTSAGKLKAKYVIHAASMRLGERAEEVNIRASIENSFKRAVEAGLKSIAFPAIGAGIAQFPMRRCAEISLEIAKKYADKLEKIVFVLYNEEAFKIFNDVYKRIIK